MSKEGRFLILSLLLFALSTPALSFNNSIQAAPTSSFQDGQANQQQSNQQEIFLSFTYRNFFEKVITAYYEDGTYYLPVSEIFSSLKISHEVDNGSLSIQGFYLDPDNNFRFDFSNYEVTLDNKGTFRYDASKMLVKELDFYVSLDVLSEVFDLNFSVDLNNLLLQLETPNTLPIVEEYERQRRREQQDKANIGQSYHPLMFERDRTFFGGGFFDYSLTSIINENQNSYTYNFDLGAEIAGGDLEGSAFGNYSGGSSNFTTNNLRWRYVMRNNDYLSQIYAGQTRSDGLSSRNFTGIKLTNEPIEPRYMYDSYEVEGTAPIGSEVELYYNNALYDFTRITEDEQYRFLVPLTYGTSRLRLRIYGPDGRIREREERIQIPFNFLPEGEFSYHLNAGQLDNPIFGTTTESYMTQGDVAYGISNWLTQQVGVEYFDEYSNESPVFYSSTSARVFDDYLLNLDIAPNAFYRISGNVVYPSSASWGITYSNYTDNRIYNPVGNEQEFSANAFFPLSIGEVPLNFRFQGNYAQNSPQDNMSYSIDLNSRINRLNLRFSYRDRQFGDFSLDPSTSSDLSASATYLISRTPNIPRYLQNTFISGSIDYSPGIGAFREAEIQASKSIFEHGRIQASYSRNFLNDLNFLNLGLTIDFNAFRSTSNARKSRDQYSFTQNIRGSIGYDDYNKDLTVSNRQQVGRSATSVRLYVDANNSGTYDEGDDVINEEAVRIGRAGVMSTSSEGILRFSQLQSYHRINMEVNQSEIKNPMLVPEIEKFSIVTDPNQYKPIDIPFYTSGVISGKVVKMTKGKENPQSGLRVYLDAKEDTTYKKEMRTFSDGTFYAYEIPPGNYNLYIDSKQLEFLDVNSQPDTMEVEVEALAEGDFVEGLNFTLKPKTTPEPIAADTVSADSTTDTTYISDQELYYKIQIASFRTLSKAKEVAMEAASKLKGSFSVILNTNTDLYAIRSLPLPNRNQAIQNILSYHRNTFEKAALVVLDSGNIAPDAPQSDFIKLGEFKTEDAANRFAEQTKNDLDLLTSVSFNEANEKYLVYVDERYYSKTSMESQLATIQDKPSYEDASMANIQNYSLFLGEKDERAMNFSFEIRIENPGGELDEKLLKSMIDPESGAEFKKSNGTIVFEGLISWTKTKQLQQKLADIPAIEHPITVLIEK
ncbi:hypothetical protein [Fodinibius sp.]|uniref:SPOR domain-containing protein n=1 Tax=Fodinibius sp. TaxID=1872440 RepID=UPI002ACD420D|nr:hypothetical protein [Fodinibius sp.]MDZ7657754.1 hypothetical protein [Fodinibius sp.]